MDGEHLNLYIKAQDCSSLLAELILGHVFIYFSVTVLGHISMLRFLLVVKSRGYFFSCSSQAFIEVAFLLQRMVLGQAGLVVIAQGF